MPKIKCDYCEEIVESKKVVKEENSIRLICKDCLTKDKKSIPTTKCDTCKKDVPSHKVLKYRGGKKFCLYCRIKPSK